MCDLTKFIVSSIITDIKSEVLAKLFVEEVVLSFEMVDVVVVDSDSRFRGEFQEICKTIQITFWPLSCGKHKVNSAKTDHRFLNETQAISGQDKFSHDVFV